MIYWLIFKWYWLEFAISFLLILGQNRVNSQWREVDKNSAKCKWLKKVYFSSVEWKLKQSFLMREGNSFGCRTSVKMIHFVFESYECSFHWTVFYSIMKLVCKAAFSLETLIHKFNISVFYSFRGTQHGLAKW